MDTILNFLVDNYIWIVIVSVFLILVLIGYIADQKRKLKKVKQQDNQMVVNSEINVNTQVQEPVQNQNVAPAPVAIEPVVNEPVNNVTDTIATPVFEPINNVVETPSTETPVTGINTPIVEAPIVETPINDVATSVVETPVLEPVLSQPANNLQSAPIEEEAPQTILDIPENVTDISAPVQEEIISEVTPTEIENPVVENVEVISQPETISESVTQQNVVNSWEPELAQENKDINNVEEIKDSI